MRRALRAALLRASKPACAPPAPYAAASRLRPLVGAAEATAAAAARAAVADAAFARPTPSSGRSLPPLPARLAAVTQVARGAERGVALAAAAAPEAAGAVTAHDDESAATHRAAAHAGAQWPPQQPPAAPRLPAVGADQVIMVKAFYIGALP